MKKLSLAILSAALMMSVPAMAQRTCSYSPLQEVVRFANNANDIQRLVARHVNLNAPVRCGGTLVQLAVLRGNVDVLKVLLDDGADVKTPVKLSDFGISGKNMPQEIPLIFFAAYKAPNAEILKTLIDSGLSVVETDKNGESISMYLDNNPVLAKSPIAKAIDEILLFQTSETQKEPVAEEAPAPEEAQKELKEIVEPVTKRKL